jgi:small nuclear ribonucleoprotein (snRNP)-like protein
MKEKIQKLLYNFKIHHILLFVALLYVPILLQLSENFGLMLFRTADESGYFDTIRRIHDGLKYGNITNAFSGSTYAYGFGYFIVLALITFPFYFFNFEQGIIFFIRFANVLLLVITLYAFLYLIKRHFNFSSRVLLLVTILIVSFPAVNMLLTHVHPEILQSALLILGIIGLRFYNYDAKCKYIILAGITFGAAVGTKISSILFLVVPALFFAYKLLNKQFSFKFIIKSFLFFSISFLFTAILTVHPLFIVNPKDTLNNVINEYKYFSNSLNVDAIAEFDLYQPLDNKVSIIMEWLIHPYNYGFFSFGLFYLLLVFLVYKSLLEIKNKTEFPLITMSLVLHIVTVLFYLLQSTRITSYYFVPSLLLLIPIGLIQLYQIGIQKINFKHFKLFFSLIFIIVALTNVPHDIRLADMFIQRSAYAEVHKGLYRPIVELIESNKFPRDNIYFDISIPLDVSAIEIQLSPFGYPVGSSNSTVKRMMPFNFLDEYAYVADIVIVSKRNPENYRKALEYINTGMNLIYEDNFSLVISKHPNAIQISNLSVNNIDASEWFPIKENAETGEIIWAEHAWDGLLKELYVPVNLSKVEKIELDITVDANDLSDSSLLLVFNGVGGTSNKNSWDYDMTESIKQGHNRIELRKEWFRISNGSVQWEYVTGIGFGGVMKPGTKIKINEIIFH